MQQNQTQSLLQNATFAIAMNRKIAKNLSVAVEFVVPPALGSNAADLRASVGPKISESSAARVLSVVPPRVGEQCGRLGVGGPSVTAGIRHACNSQKTCGFEHPRARTRLEPYAVDVNEDLPQDGPARLHG